MICRTCLRQAARLPLRPFYSTATRSFSTTWATRNAAAAPAASEASSAPAAAADDAASDAAAALSSCPKGTVLNGLNYFKGKTDPVALADDAYPAWLWDCLSVTHKAATEDTGAAADEFSKSKKQRRLALRKQRELEAKILASGDLSALAPKIPLQHQTVNLPAAEDGSAEGAVRAAETREELRRAMRKERKAKIKETNYLKSM